MNSLCLRTSLLIRPTTLRSVFCRHSPAQLLSYRFLSTTHCLRTTPPSKKTITKNNESQISSDVFTIPNVITMSRIATTPLVGYFILSNNLIPAMGLFAYSCITDFLDGYIARKYYLKSVAGSILDPIADKLLMITTTIALSLPPGPQLVPPLIATLILGRDVLLGISGVVIRYVSMCKKYTKEKVTWSSYWNFFKYPTVLVTPTRISKWNTFLQMIYLGLGVGILLMEPYKKTGKSHDGWTTLKEQARRAFNFMGYVVTVTTIWSGTSYLFSKNAITLILK